MSPSSGALTAHPRASRVSSTLSAPFEGLSPLCTGPNGRHCRASLMVTSTTVLVGSKSSPSLSSSLVGSVPTNLTGLGTNLVWSGGAGSMSSQLPPTAPPLASQGSLRRRSKTEIADHFIANLRARGMTVEPEAAADIRAHFESLPSRCAGGTPETASRPRSRSSASPCLPTLSLPSRPCLCIPFRRYALDVNISSLDVLNHKRLLDSARSDPSAVSFQLRPVDVVSGSDLAKRPSFGSLDVLHHQQEVRLRPWLGCPAARTSPRAPQVEP